MKNKTQSALDSIGILQRMLTNGSMDPEEVVRGVEYMVSKSRHPFESESLSDKGSVHVNGLKNFPLSDLFSGALGVKVRTSGAFNDIVLNSSPRSISRTDHRVRFVTLRVGMSSHDLHEKVTQGKFPTTEEYLASVVSRIRSWKKGEEIHGILANRHANAEIVDVGEGKIATPHFIFDGAIVRFHCHDFSNHFWHKGTKFSLPCEM